MPPIPVRFRIAALTALLAAAAFPQTKPSLDAGFAGRAMAHVRRLAEPAGRVAGSEGETRAARYVQQQMEAAGLSVTVEPFEFQTFVLESAELTAGDRKAGILKLAFDPYTSGDRRSGDLAFVESTADFAAVLQLALDDKIVVAAEGANIYAIATMKKPRAVVSLARADFDRLRSGAAPSGEIAFRGKVVKAASANIVGVLPSAFASGKEVILSAHYDSWRGPGANDNASGVAVLLELARHYRSLQPPPAMPLRFVAFGAEELGMLGAKAYLARHADELNRCHLLFNIDSVGGSGAVVTDTRGGVKGIPSPVRNQLPADLTGRAGADIDARWTLLHPGQGPLFDASNVPAWLRDAAADAGRASGRESRAAHGMGSDHRVFVQAGVVATGIAVSASPSRAHTPEDTPESLDPQGLAVAAGVVASVVEQAMRPVPAPRPDPQLAAYLNANEQTPEDYVTAKFTDHDLVLLGENHRIRHDVELVGRLIPRLYRAGVRHLGIESGVTETQTDADALLSAPTFDDDKAR